MELPKVPTEAKSQKLNFTFRVMAYRQLTHTEMHQVYLFWRQQSKQNKPMKDKVVTITSLIGL
jgi:hypothetical protein